jgi:hypothetical protein
VQSCLLISTFFKFKSGVFAGLASNVGRLDTQRPTVLKQEKTPARGRKAVSSAARRDTTRQTVLRYHSLLLT